MLGRLFGSFNDNVDDGLPRKPTLVSSSEMSGVVSNDGVFTAAIKYINQMNASSSIICIHLKRMTSVIVEEEVL